MKEEKKVNIDSLIPALGIFYAWQGKYSDNKGEISQKEEKRWEEYCDLVYEADCLVEMIIKRRQEEDLSKHLKELKDNLQKAAELYLPTFKEEPLYESAVELLKQIEEKKYS